MNVLLQPEPPELLIVLAYPDNGSASISAITEVFNENPPSKKAPHAEPLAITGTPAAQLDPDRLPLAATNSETATQAFRVSL
nr:hypothetical protein [Collimonas humicola]